MLIPIIDVLGMNVEPMKHLFPSVRETDDENRLVRLLIDNAGEVAIGTLLEIDSETRPVRDRPRTEVSFCARNMVVRAVVVWF